MGQQREQLEGADRIISATMAVALQARAVLNDMYVNQEVNLMDLTPLICFMQG